MRITSLNVRTRLIAGRALAARAASAATVAVVAGRRRAPQASVVASAAGRWRARVVCRAAAARGRAAVACARGATDETGRRRSSMTFRSDTETEYPSPKIMAETALHRLKNASLRVVIM